MKSGREMSLWGKGCPENQSDVYPDPLPAPDCPSAVPDSQPQGEGSVLMAEGAETQDVP